MANVGDKCQAPYRDATGKTVLCGGAFEEVVQMENGRRVLYEVCENKNCGNKRALVPITMKPQRTSQMLRVLNRNKS